MGKDGTQGTVPRRSFDRRWMACGLCLAAIALAAVAGTVQHHANIERQQERFDRIADAASGMLEERLGTFEHGLRGARGAIISAGPQMSRARFGAYSASREYAREFPGVRGFGFIQRVAPDEEAAFEQEAERDGMPGFAVRQLTPHAGERFVIRYAEPMAGNEAAIGLDLASESARRQAAVTAARSGRATLTPPVTLVQDTGLARHGFLLLLPVYAPGARIDTEDARWDATRGWAYAVLTIDAVLERLDTTEHQPYALALSDVAEETRTGPFYADRDFAALRAAWPRTERRIGIYGRDWRLRFHARPEFPASIGILSPWLVGATVGGLGLLSIAVWYLVATARVRRRAAFLDHAQLATLVAGSTETIIACDPSGAITLWNGAAERAFGYSSAEAVGRPMAELLVDEQGRPAFPDLGADAHGRPCRLRRRDGTTADVVASISLIRDAAGRVQGLSLFLHDITRHLRAEEQFRRVVEASPSAILMVDQAGRVQLANAKAEELFGYPREELLGQPMDQLLPMDIRGHHAGYIDSYFGHPQARPMGAGRDLYGLRRDGTRVPIEIGLNPIHTAEGRFALAFIIDITERKRHEEGIMRLNATLEQQVLDRTAQLRTYSSRLGAILEHAGYAIISTDLHGRISLFNPAAERMLGHAASAVTGGEVSIDLLHDGEELAAHAQELAERTGHAVGATFAQIAAASTAAGSGIAEWTYVRSDGTRLPVALNVSALRDEHGTASGFLVMASDLTERRLRDAQLHQAISAAEQANRSKSDFLANMSHEIRTPMNAILGMLYLLNRVDLPVVAQDMTRKISQAARSLLSIINDVLDFSKIEAGRIDVEDAPFDLAEVLDNVAALMASAVDTRAVEMLVSPAPEGARHLRGDALRLGQVLVNLVSNAIKFTEHGEVSLQVEPQHGAPPGCVRLRFSVADTGIGIPAEKQAMIFSPFSQVDSSTTRRFGGTGLGLSISNRLVELMGGTLCVDSQVGDGSTFRFDLDFALADTPEAARPFGGPWHVLVVDDHDMAREHLSLIVRGFGWTTEEVDSGERAVAALDRHDAGYDVVLMDWQMPGIDGLSAAAGIRGHLRSARQPIIIMVTAFERNLVDREAHRDAVDAVLTKPVTASVLYDTIGDVLARRDPGLRTRVGVPAQRRLAGYRVLVVDDSEINREVAQRILEGEGAQATQACAGREALERPPRAPQAFDVVLMDVQMPVMDGYEATRHVRTSPALAHLPVIALTAGAFKPQQDAALAAGMSAFVAKPFEVPDLVAAILRCTPERAALVPQPAELPESQHVAASIPDIAMSGDAHADTVNPELLDVQKGLAHWRDAAPYKRYLAQFARRYGGIVDTIEACLARHDTKQACAEVHRMRGAAASLAMPSVVAIGSDIEEQIRQGADVADLLPLLRLSLRETLQDVAQYLGPGGIESAQSDDGGEGDVATALRGLLDALDSDDADRVESALAGLPAGVPRAERERLALHVEEFDYRGAERLARALLEALPPDADPTPREGRA